MQAISVFKLINWRISALRTLDRKKTRTLLTLHRHHHPKANVDTIFLQPSEGGWGLSYIENYYKIKTVGLAE